MKLKFLNLIIIILCYYSVQAQVNKQQLTYDDFKLYLKKDLNYESIVNIFGQPSNEVGSGIFIYEYHLYDSTKFFIGYYDKIIFAEHIDKDHNIIHKLFNNDDLKNSYACIDFYFNNYESESIEKPIDEILKYNAFIRGATQLILS